MQGTCMSNTIYCVVLWDKCQHISVVTTSKARVRGDKIYKRHLLHQACVILKTHNLHFQNKEGMKINNIVFITYSFIALKDSANSLTLRREARLHIIASTLALCC